MNISDLKNNSVGIIGFGKEGQAVLKFLTQNGVSATVFDRTPNEELSIEAQKLLSADSIKYFGGDDYLLSALNSCKVWFKSPGVLLPNDILQSLKSKEIILTSQTAWFFEHCPATIIGITGTKGKGTTSSLIHEVLLAAGHQSFLTGNIGLESAFDVLSKATAKDFVVFELSSFQLEHLQQSPGVAVCLMVTNDHYDYHETQTEYWNAKAAIAKFQNSSDVLFFNGDYDGSIRIGNLGQGKKFTISKYKQHNPQICIDESNQTIAIALNDQRVVIDASQRNLLGNHNLENIAAASAVAAYLGISQKTIEKVITTFQGLPHRLQVVGIHDGITFIDDSIATNPDTTIAAVNSIDKPIVLLLGGADKQLDYSELMTHLAGLDNLKHIILIGEVGAIMNDSDIAPELKQKVSGPFKDFKSAMNQVFEVTSPGETVLLSPAATSFDMFKNYAERGNIFTQLIREHYGKN